MRKIAVNARFPLQTVLQVEKKCEAPLHAAPRPQLKNDLKDILMQRGSLRSLKVVLKLKCMSHCNLAGDTAGVTRLIVRKPFLPEQLAAKGNTQVLKPQAGIKGGGHRETSMLCGQRGVGAGQQPPSEGDSGARRQGLLQQGARLASQGAQRPTRRPLRLLGPHSEPSPAPRRQTATRPPPPSQAQ